MKIKKFIINNLYGYKQIKIDFENPIKILIGENGLGKTTVLNIIYFTLSKKFDRLSKINFESIDIIIDTKNKITIKKEILLKHLNRDNEISGSHFSEYLTKLNKDQTKNLRNLLDDASISPQFKRIELQNFLKEVGININAPAQYVFDLVKKHYNEFDANKFEEVIRQLDEYVDCKILYFPTYRRIEEEIKNIGYVSREELNEKYAHFISKKDLFSKLPQDDDIIQFGMKDVEDRIDKITSKIAHSSIIGFSDITAEMLHQLLTDFPNVKTKSRNKIDIDKLNIILERIGPNMSQSDRQQITEYIKKGETSNKGLLFFIDKLIELYNKQETQDTAIKNFVEVCNFYLSEKKYFYNEREVSLNIQHENENYAKFNKSSKVINLNQLSSGEKQIVSLFSKIYLEEDERYIVLFDEPELSLSIFWQKRLLPDILKSKKCDLMVAVTHSPFIYDNELYEFTNGLSEYES